MRKGFPLGGQAHDGLVAVPEISIHWPVCMFFACSEWESEQFNLNVSLQLL